MVSCNKRVQDSNLSAGFATDHKLCSDHKPSFNQNEVSRKICIFRCKTHLSIQGKNSNSCKKLSRNQNNFSSCQQVRRVQQYLEQTPPSAQFSRVLCSRYTIASNVPVTYFYPQIINFFWWGKESTKLYSKKSPICIQLDLRKHKKCG